GRTVAIKILPSAFSNEPERRERFRREARAISQLSHPHVCALYDVGQHDGLDYFVMEYLEGDTLEYRLRGGPLPLGLLLEVATDIADALAWSHRQGIAHRGEEPQTDGQHGEIARTVCAQGASGFSDSFRRAQLGGVLATSV